MPKVSVIIPTYNRAHYITQALESVFAQTFRDFEVVVVDDGSTDNTKEALSTYMESIRYIRQENRGEAAARNSGIRASTGEWVAFLDSDDMWEPQTLETLIEASRVNPDAGLIAMRARAIRSDGSRTNRTFGKKKVDLSFTTKSLLWGESGAIMMPMVRRHLFEKVGGFDESIPSAADCDMWLRLSFHTRMVGVPEPLLLCRIHGENVSGDRSLNARMWIRILEKFSAEHPEFVRSHPWFFRRAMGKESIRLGRELLALSSGNAATLREARCYLLRSIATFPFFLRAYVYLLWSYIFPESYERWRKWERSRRV
ncbi:MAG: glycosyltransferase [Acidobacteriota bacterium]